MANDHFYGYKRDPKKVKTLTGARGSVDLDFESINPYEFKKGMDYELSKAGVPSLREASEEAREKATENVIKNLKDTHGAYYSYLEHYETTTRNMEKKPSFNAFLKEIEGYSMKEIKDNFDNDKMKEIKLKENIRIEVRAKLNEILKLNEGYYGSSRITEPDANADKDIESALKDPRINFLLSYATQGVNPQLYRQLRNSIENNPELVRKLLLAIAKKPDLGWN